MRVIDLLAAYAVLGVLCALAVVRRRRPSSRVGVVDVVLTLLVWPLYVPVLLGGHHKGGAAGQAGPEKTGLRRIEHEHQQLLAALDAVADPTLARLLPTREHLRRLVDHLIKLDEKVRELNEVLAQDEFDAERAEHALRSAERHGGSEMDNARLVCESIGRLLGLRDRAARERDELLGLCARLRMQVTVLRFAGTTPEDIGDLVAEILGRIEGVGAAIETQAGGAATSAPRSDAGSDDRIVP